MTKTTGTYLKHLARIQGLYGDGHSRCKTDLLQLLDRRRFKKAGEVLRLHEILCFLRAYPDDRELLAHVEDQLSRFADRSDLRRFRKALADTGVAGTAINYQFFWFTATWLARRWPQQISINWTDFDRSDKLADMLHLLLLYSETPATDELDFSPREWIDQLKHPDETDAAFVIRRFDALRATSFGREKFYEDLDIPMQIKYKPGTASRTHAKYNNSPVIFQNRPLDYSRPDMFQAMNQPAKVIHSVPPHEGQNLINMAREAMITRSRDLDSFMHADKNDVRLVDFGDGYQFVCFGAIPERRLILESVYGYLTLKNGVPIGYVLTSSLFNSAAVGYNVFETYRGAESAAVYGRILGMTRALFGVDVVCVDPYQLGHDNTEGQESGAWWFYQKLGFQSHDPNILKLMRRELARIKRNRKYRSSNDTLQDLTAEHLFLYLDKPREDVIGRISLGNIGLQIVRYLAKHFGSDRETAARVCADEAAKCLGVRSRRSFTVGEKQAWERWSPLILALPGIKRWSLTNKKALVHIVKAKGGRRESDFVKLFDKHHLLRRALLKLSERD
ncbi:MAG: hypothetical protein KJ970_17380 [Candidatus Eisenbacteria bacterium]|uniref:Uncharacterized protein n=1 Tax=Eiseniibacteriota bacterium TaxID=2212470 RepID=A0A948RYB9_UNCEI|nr:hypothetical protein [Candidatus Eisenbacteria bacterium]MBU1949057.1 hypothetical protein [Candidatus Eisenbacteria bacterium]MBU2692691.1 hypothetical protein [Candidatus Eisenbacteria bacterium]